MVPPVHLIARFLALHTAAAHPADGVIEFKVLRNGNVLGTARHAVAAGRTGDNLGFSDDLRRLGEHLLVRCGKRLKISRFLFFV